MVLFDLLQELVRVVPVHRRMVLATLEPIAGIPKVAFPSVHDRVPVCAGRIVYGLADFVASVQVVDVEPESGCELRGNVVLESGDDSCAFEVRS